MGTPRTASSGKNILMQPVVPIYDIAGNFASGKAVGLGNQSNPLKFAYERRNNINRNNKVFGNAFAGFQLLPTLALRSSSASTRTQRERSRASTRSRRRTRSPASRTRSTSSRRTTSTGRGSNTARYNKSLGQHTINLLAGQEANHSHVPRHLRLRVRRSRSTDPNNLYLQDALGDASTLTVNSATAAQSALLSYFGKADYNFAGQVRRERHGAS